jgi:hypothetical protein
LKSWLFELLQQHFDLRIPELDDRLFAVVAPDGPDCNRDVSGPEQEGHVGSG